MVFEQVLTILFAICVGAAIIVYAAKPRQRSVPASITHTSVQSFQAPVQVAPVAEVVAEAPAPVVETPAAIEVLSAPEAAPAVAEVSSPVSGEVALETASLASPSDVVAAVVSSHPEGAETASPSSTRRQRTARRKSTTTRSRKSGSRTRKSQA